MPSASDHRDRAQKPYEQPGLEVTPQEQLEHSAEWSRLQVASNPSEYYQGNGKEVVSGYWGNDKIPVATDYVELPQTEKAPPPTKHRKPLWYILGGIIFLSIVLGAVLGGVLASRAKTADSTGSPTGEAGDEQPTGAPSPTSNANTTTKLQSLRQGSPLTVTGWRKTIGTEIYLFYQDHDNGIRGSRYDDTLSFAGNTSWQSLDKYSSFASEATRLAGTIIQYGEGYLPQTELFYTSDRRRLLGISINERFTPSYEEDSIKNMLLTTGLNSSVSAYWPWITYQGSDGELVEVRNRLRAELSPAAEWDARRLGIVAADASRLALVPLSTNFTKIATKGGYGILYQGTDGRLACVVPEINSTSLSKDYAPSWPTNFPSISLPEHGAFAAFSVARPADSLQRVNTYVLYLDTSSNINVVYADSDLWSTAQPSVLKGVDSDTDISCLTMTTTYRNSSKSEVLLGEASEETRCYFQRNGLLMEVVFNGDAWVDAGNVPIS